MQKCLKKIPNFFVLHKIPIYFLMMLILLLTGCTQKGIIQDDKQAYRSEGADKSAGIIPILDKNSGQLQQSQEYSYQQLPDFQKSAYDRKQKVYYGLKDEYLISIDSQGCIKKFSPPLPLPQFGWVTDVAYNEKKDAVIIPSLTAPFYEFLPAEKKWNVIAKITDIDILSLVYNPNDGFLYGFHQDYYQGFQLLKISAAGDILSKLTLPIPVDEDSPTPFSTDLAMDGKFVVLFPGIGQDVYKIDVGTGKMVEKVNVNESIFKDKEAAFERFVREVKGKCASEPQGSVQSQLVYQKSPAEYLEENAALHYIGVGNPGEDNIVEVHVSTGTSPVTILLASYNAVLWRVTADPGTNIGSIILSGYEKQRIYGEDPESIPNFASINGVKIPVAVYTFKDNIESGVKMSKYVYHDGTNEEGDSTYVAYLSALKEIEEFIGREPATFQGGYEERNYVIDGVQTQKFDNTESSWEPASSDQSWQ